MVIIIIFHHIRYNNNLLIVLLKSCLLVSTQELFSLPEKYQETLVNEEQTGIASQRS